MNSKSMCGQCVVNLQPEREIVEKCAVNSELYAGNVYLNSVVYMSTRTQSAAYYLSVHMQSTDTQPTTLWHPYAAHYPLAPIRSPLPLCTHTQPTTLVHLAESSQRRLECGSPRPTCSLPCLPQQFASTSNAPATISQSATTMKQRIARC